MAKTPEFFLMNVHPDLLPLWDADANTAIDPFSVGTGSKTKHAWLCPAGHDHAWKSSAQHMVARVKNGTTCPFCANQRVSVTNSLAAVDPVLAAQWHPTKNGSLTAYDVIYASTKVGWWKCPVADDHVWQTRMSQRRNGHGCPCCAGHQLSTTNSFAVVHPHIAKEWHQTKNSTLPSDYMSSSTHDAWWICSACSHQWRTKIFVRVQGAGCTACAKIRVTPENCLAAVNPTVSLQWHPTKNGSLTPETVSANSHDFAWWICDSNHEWDATIASRNSGHGCPYCSGRRRLEENSLFALHPELCEEWGHERNVGLDPSLIAPYTRKKVWWVCRDCEQPWKASVSNRVKKRGCPHCASGLKTSFLEQAIYFYLKSVFPLAKNHYHLSCETGQMEIDIWVPELSLCIEVDGYHHRTRTHMDELKNEETQKQQLTMLRFREKGLPSVGSFGSHVCEYERDDDKKRFTTSEAVRQLARWIAEQFTLDQLTLARLSELMSADARRDEAVIYAQYKTLPFAKSVAATHPHLAQEWNPDQNSGLKPTMFTRGSKVRITWSCQKCGNEWPATIDNRANKGSGCPVCGSQSKSQKLIEASFKKYGSIAKSHPHLLEFWDGDKNMFLPDDVHLASKREAFWKCSNGHAWNKRIDLMAKRKYPCMQCRIEEKVRL